LFTPCCCRGTMAFVHSSCLEEWRRLAPKESSITHCDYCAYKYVVGRWVDPSFKSSSSFGSFGISSCLTRLRRIILFYLRVRPLARHGLTLLFFAPTLMFLLSVMRRPALLLRRKPISVSRALRTGSSLASSIGWGLAILESAVRLVPPGEAPNQHNTQESVVSEELANPLEVHVDVLASLSVRKVWHQLWNLQNPLLSLTMRDIMARPSHHIAAFQRVFTLYFLMRSLAWHGHGLMFTGLMNFYRWTFVLISSLLGPPPPLRVLPRPENQ